MKFLMFQLYLNWRSESLGVTISKFSKLSLILLQRDFSSESFFSNKSLLFTRGLFEFLSEDFLLDVCCLFCLHGDVMDWRKVLTPAMVFLTLDTSSGWCWMTDWGLGHRRTPVFSVQYCTTLYISPLLLFSTVQYWTHSRQSTSTLHPPPPHQSCTNSNI